MNYHARWVVPVTSPPLRDATVSVDGPRITYVGSRGSAPAGESLDLEDSVLLPGLVNAHTHLELTPMRGFLEGVPFVDWIRTLTRARAEVLSNDALLDGARWGLAEGLAAGVTTYADTSASGVVLRALGEMGVRGIMYQEVFGPSPEQHDASLGGLRAAVDSLRPLETPLTRLGISPHAVYTVHEDLLIDTAAYAIAERLPMAMHLAESDAEIAFLREGEGPFADGLRARGIAVHRRSHSPVHLLVELRVVLAHPLLIHCVKVDATDIEFIAENHCPVAHCPASNAKLGHGIAPLRQLLDAGVVVGLGTDSVASNNRMDLLAEARLALLLQDAKCGSPSALSAHDALALATIGGARALGLNDRVGSLEVGKDADLVAFSLADAASTPAYDPVTTTVCALAGGAGRALLVTIAGVERVRDGRVLGFDASGVAARVQASADALAAWRMDQSRH